MHDSRHSEVRHPRRPERFVPTPSSRPVVTFDDISAAAASRYDELRARKLRLRCGTTSVAPAGTCIALTRAMNIAPVSTCGSRKLLAEGALIVALAFATAAFAQPASGHLACYRVKDPVRKGPSTLTLTNAGVTQPCSIGSRAQLACLK